jgi:hypothetical protein
LHLRPDVIRDDPRATQASNGQADTAAEAFSDGSAVDVAHDLEVSPVVSVAAVSTCRAFHEPESTVSPWPDRHRPHRRDTSAGNAFRMLAGRRVLAARTSVATSLWLALS